MTQGWRVDGGGSSQSTWPHPILVHTQTTTYIHEQHAHIQPQPPPRRWCASQAKINDQTSNRNYFYFDVEDNISFSPSVYIFSGLFSVCFFVGRYFRLLFDDKKKGGCTVQAHAEHQLHIHTATSHSGSDSRIFAVSPLRVVWFWLDIDWEMCEAEEFLFTKDENGRAVEWVSTPEHRKIYG